MEPSKPSCSTSCATSDTEKQPKGSIPELLKDDETQIKEFAYMFYRPTYHVLHREYFRSDDKVRFYMGLPSSKILVATLNHVAPYVSQRTQTLDPYQEFIMVLIKLHLSISFQDLTYRFLVSVTTVSHLLIVDNCHGLWVVSACLLVREREKIFGKQCQWVSNMPLATW